MLRRHVSLFKYMIFFFFLQKLLYLGHFFKGNLTPVERKQEYRGHMLFIYYTSYYRKCELYIKAKSIYQVKRTL